MGGEARRIRIAAAQDPLSPLKNNARRKSPSPKKGKKRESCETTTTTTTITTTTKTVVHQRNTNKTLITSPPEQKVWTIKDFDVGRGLGRGKFGNVYYAREKDSKRVVAIKVLLKKSLIAEEVAHQLKKEVEIHSRIRHPHILPLYATFQDEKKVYLVLRYAAGGDLYKELHSTPDGYFDEETARRYTSQLIRALMECHKHHVIHRDIKPENCLLTHSKDLLLADFGWSSSRVSKKNRRGSLCGTLDYVAPEMLNGDLYDHSVDIWSAGCMLFEFLVGHPPFESDQKPMTFELIATASVIVPSSVSMLATDLIKKLLNKDPKSRISLEDALAHPWFNEFTKRQKTE